MHRIFAVALILGIFLSGTGFLAQQSNAAETPAKVELLYCKGVNLMPMLLATNQIDGYFAWQPYLSMAEKSGIGKIVVASRNFPPGWSNHPCCVLVASDRLLENHQDLVTTLCYLNMVSTKWVCENPKESNEITENWLMGCKNYTLVDGAISSNEVFENSRPYLIFSCEQDNAWWGGMNALIAQMASLLDESPGSRAGIKNVSFFDFDPYNAAKTMLKSGKLNSTKPIEHKLVVGYLMIDHEAPLFAAIKNWRYFNERYGIALKPQNNAARPQMLDLLVKGEKVAEVELVTAPTGLTLMTLMDQNCMDMAYVGVTPAIGSILFGGKVKIILPVQNEGSGLVLRTDYNARSWDDFVALARARTAQGRPLKLGDPDQGTITDVILQVAFNESGIQGVKA